MIHEAIQFAAVAHRNQKRKGTDIPYIVHPFEVAQILTAVGADEEVIVAGLLHDTIEDTDVILDDIAEQFGRQVGVLVLACSENKEKAWEERKRHTIAYLQKDCPYDAMEIICADKLSNLRSIAADYAEVGETVWQRFSRGREEQCWYYENLLHVFEPLEDLDMYEEYQQLFFEVFGS